MNYKVRETFNMGYGDFGDKEAETQYFQTKKEAKK